MFSRNYDIHWVNLGINKACFQIIKQKKVIAKRGIRTHACKCTSDLESNASAIQALTRLFDVFEVKQKLFPKSKIRTHASKCTLDLESNVLTTQPSKHLHVCLMYLKLNKKQMFAKSGVRTHACNCTLNPTSNVLTTRASTYKYYLF